MSALLARLTRIFLGELDERVGALNHDLLALEKETSDAARTTHFANLFRSAHSLKGAAAAVEIGLIETACHRLEAIFADASTRAEAPSSELCELLFAVFDAIQDAGDRLRRDEDIAHAALAALMPRLAGAADGLPDATATPIPQSPSPAPEPTGEGDPAPQPIEPVGEREAPPSDLVRIGAEKLDRLLARSGELMVTQRRAAMRRDDIAALQTSFRSYRADWLRRRSTRQGPARRRGGDDGLSRGHRERLRQIERDLERLGDAFAADQLLLAQAIHAVDRDVRQARMQPLAEICTGLERAVRDLAKAGGKEVHLTVSGGDVELDRSLLDRLKDSLLHLVRNAVDHGIETPQTRVAAGKPARGEIRIVASLVASSVAITIEDDGGGLNLSAIRERADRMGLSIADDAASARAIFARGLSTSPLLTRVSGRGIGLDATKIAVEQMRGTVEVCSKPGEGTCFTLTLPLTLTTLRALLVRVDGQTFAFDSVSVVVLKRVLPELILSVGGRDVLAHDGRFVPVVRLASLLGLPEEKTFSASEKQPIVLLKSNGTIVGFLVDGLIDEQELVIRKLGSRLKRVRHVAGATILADGRVALILNGSDLVAAAFAQELQPGARERLSTGSARSSIPERKRLLLVDDSITTRALERSILESAGYEVTAVADGADAWRVLQEDGADLVVSDVDMPLMDGFSLTEAIRGSTRFHTLPVVLVTARESDQEKARGMALGADAYLLKSSFDQQALLDTVGQLL